MVGSIADAQNAVIRIEVSGSFHFPSDDKPMDSGFSGSGFIIDPSGLAITNNHVVAGASIIKVYVGEQKVPRSAQVVARSECSDLALIDIAGGGYDYFDWYDGEIRTGQKIYAAGFPLGDPEFTLTGGIVSKDQASAGLDTYWASLKHQIEHDARLNPGNSGGPLLTEDAKVIGVNYSGNESTRQEWAISVKEVLPILDELKAGWDVHSIGINGEAFYDYSEDRYGIWVVSVESGTPADLVGLQPGDLITRVENMAVGDDETMGSYCDILRSHAIGDVLKIQVYRASTGEELVGRLNASPLEPETVPGEGLPELPGDSAGTGDVYSEYAGIWDDTGSIFVEVPVVFEPDTPEPLMA
jgi:serine protease Do